MSYLINNTTKCKFLLENNNNYCNLDNAENISLNARLGDPYFISEILEPLNTNLYADQPIKKGGLSYLNDNTIVRDKNVVKKLYKKIYGYTIPDDFEIIFGCGSTNLGAAYIYAVQKKLNKLITVSSPKKVTYGIYRNVANFSKNTQWIDQDPNADLYTIVSPDNPDGYIFSYDDVFTFTNNNNPYLLIDCIYDTRIFNDQSIINTWAFDLLKDSNLSNNIGILSSFSKLGIPGLRYGFMFIKDPELIEYINYYIFNIVVVPPSAGGQFAFKAWNIFWKHMEWHKFINKKLKKRFKQIYELAEQNNFNILNYTNYAPYIYTDKSTDWWLTNYNIITRKGSDFNDTDEHSRLSMFLYDCDWKILIKKLKLNLIK